MKRRLFSLFSSLASAQPLVELDPAALSRIAGGDGPHGGWGMPSAPPTGNPSTGDVWTDLFGPHGGWKSDVSGGPHGGW